MNKITDWYGSTGLTIGIAADHGGFELKAKLIPFLGSKGMTVRDFGPSVYDAGDDYSVFGSAMAKAVSKGEIQLGILLCRSGAGMVITADRFHGVRAVVAFCKENTAASRAHNCSNVLVLPADYMDEAKMKELIEVWLSTPFSGDARHVRRLEILEKRTYDDIAAVRSADPEIGRASCRERVLPTV